VRAILPFVVIFCGASCLFAQEQESKLVDRLLRPDMTLANSAQTKQFNGAGGQAAARSASVKEFSASASAEPKEFGGKKSFLSRMFGGHRLRAGDTNADVSTRSSASAGPASLGRQTSILARSNSDEGKAVGTRQFAATGPFLERGKSQKALSAQDRPLTVDEVRELLNRNK
jgi:hypothetical protein